MQLSVMSVLSSWKWLHNVEHNEESLNLGTGIPKFRLSAVISLSRGDHRTGNA